MKKGLSLVAVAVLLLIPIQSPLAAEDLQSTLVSIEESLWEAWKKGDAAPFKTHLTEDSMMITTGGVSSKEQAIKDITSGQCKVTSYSLSDMKVRTVTSDTAILTYKAAQDAICEGNKIPAEVYASSVYVKQGGKWLAASYQETPIK